MWMHLTKYKKRAIIKAGGLMIETVRGGRITYVAALLKWKKFDECMVGRYGERYKLKLSHLQIIERDELKEHIVKIRSMGEVLNLTVEEMVKISTEHNVRHPLLY